MTKRHDPEPITIIAAIAAVTGASISAVNYWRTHHGPLPHKIRKNLISKLDQLGLEVRYLRSDIKELESIFKHADFLQGRTLRLGNGALLTFDEFRRYELLADHVFTRLKKLHKLALKVQGLAFDLPFTDKRETLNVSGESLSRAERLMQSRNFSVDEAWRDLEQLATDLELMAKQLGAELGLQ